MTSIHPTLTPSELVDDYTPAPVVRSDVVYEGRVWDVVQEEADLGDAGRVTRDFVRHPGAVAVLAMRGEPGAEEVLVIRQYRHPIGAQEWEQWDDGWTAVTRDRRRSAQFEHTILITDEGNEILTLP